jgi:hypothetical protein
MARGSPPSIPLDRPLLIDPAPRWTGRTQRRHGHVPYESGVSLHLWAVLARRRPARAETERVAPGHRRPARRGDQARHARAPPQRPRPRPGTRAGRSLPRRGRSRASSSRRLTKCRAVEPHDRVVPTSGAILPKRQEGCHRTVFVTDREGASAPQTSVRISRGNAVIGSGAVHTAVTFLRFRSRPVPPGCSSAPLVQHEIDDPQSARRRLAG